MNLTMLKSKIHRAKVTQANLNYEGSITIDIELCNRANILPFEKVEIYNCNNGERFATYVIYGKKGEVCLNGAAARLVQPGDLVIICAYISLDSEDVTSHTPRLVFVDENNQPKI